MKRKLLLFGLFISSVILFNIFTPSVVADDDYYNDYSFDVDYMKVDVQINKNGSITIEYWINFTCDWNGHRIDYVDIGFPNKHYILSSVVATLDDAPVTVTGPSPYIETGVEIYLGSKTILPNKSGQLYVKCINPNMIYQDYEDNTLASVVFSPTWFDSSFCPTYEHLEVNIYFPDGLKDGNLVKYHGEKFTSYSNDTAGDLIYTWTKLNVAMQQYTFGVSFPSSYVDTYLPYTMNPAFVFMIVAGLLTFSIISLIVVGGFLLYRYNKAYKKRYYPPVAKSNPGDMCGVICGISVFGLFISMMFWSIFEDAFLIVAFFGIIIAAFGMIGLAIYLALIKGKLGKLPYSKPDVKIDCVGVNRKLSVVEAAIIQNTPLNKVMFLIIFSLIRTGHLKIISAEPLKFEVVEAKKNENLKTYQSGFIKAVKKTGKDKGTLDDVKLKKVVVDLIKGTYKKMRGYKLDATEKYYQNMIYEAWKKVKAMPREIEWEDIEKNYEFLILDDEFKQKSKKHLSNRYYYHRPYYYHHYYYYDHYYYRRRYHRYYPSRTAEARIPKQHINIHTFSDSIVRGIENISNNIVTSFSAFSDKIAQAVAPVRPRATGGGRSSGGSGCACACACAGCACACAGGGR